MEILSYLVRCIISFNAGSGVITIKWLSHPTTVLSMLLLSLRWLTNKKNPKQALQTYAKFITQVIGKDTLLTSLA